MRVAVLGCGPAGLIAAHAANVRGHQVSIISKRRKSEMFGAQYLHQPIPEANPVGEPLMINYELVGGTAADYRQKVYGHEFAGPVSPEDLTEPHLAWDIRATYNLLWSWYFSFIEDIEFDRGNLATIMAALFKNYDVVINSMPRPVLCLARDIHQFPAQKVWAIGDAPERGVFAPTTIPDNTVVCDASRDTGWYRASNIFGYRTVEWSTRKKPPVAGIAEVVKPLATDCTCWPTIRHVGRYGKWQKGVLSHTAYADAVAALEPEGISIQ